MFFGKKNIGSLSQCVVTGVQKKQSNESKTTILTSTITGDMSESSTSTFTPTENTAKNQTLITEIAIYGGAGLGALIVIAILIYCCIKYRRKRMMKNYFQTTHYNDAYLYDF